MIPLGITSIGLKSQRIKGLGKLSEISWLFDGSVLICFYRRVV
jgi:hypothetical protein